MFNILCKKYECTHIHVQNIIIYAHAYIAQYTEYSNKMHEKLYGANTVTNVQIIHNIYNTELQINFIQIYNLLINTYIIHFIQSQHKL